MTTTLTKKEFLAGLKDPKSLKKVLVHRKLKELYSEIVDKIWKYTMNYEKDQKLFIIKIHYIFNVDDESIKKLIDKIFLEHPYYSVTMNYYSVADHQREFWIRLT